MAGPDDAYVLIVDDEEHIREMYQRILEAAGYTVETATNSHEALRLIAATPPAVAICDIHMPGPSGLWLADQIRAQSPHTAMLLATSDSKVPPIENLKKGV